MVDFLFFPVIPTVFTKTYCPICDIPCSARYRGALAVILFLLGDCQHQFDGEEAKPKHDINNPPPGPNADPPDDAVALLLVF